MSVSECCSTCHYRQDIDPVRGDTGATLVDECHRNAPTTFLWFRRGRWPKVSHVDWCGEYRRKDNITSLKKAS